jgi:hypothetical protein
MAFLEGEDIWDAYDAACSEAKVWREDYPEFERLMNNGLLPDIDETLPEVNDGSLAASLFKLPKRIFNSDLTGRAKSLDTEDSDSSWITELANIVWETKIIKNANTQATFHRKWKDAIRKAAGFGGQPLITLFTHRGNYTGSDFIVPIAQDVKLEAGKVSDMDSDIIFWDVYYSRLGLANIIEDAEEEMQDDLQEKAEYAGRKAQYQAQLLINPDLAPFDEEPPESYNVWDIATLQQIYDDKLEEDRSPDEDSEQRKDKAVKRGGYHFYIAFQRGVEAPFGMYHKDFKDKPLRLWSNPDPTGDTPVHYLYCYQDFVNPYGVGIVKLAGGTQNVLDYMRQAHVKAVQVAVDPPLDVHGETDNTDLDSLVNTQRALWFTGDAIVKPVKIADQVVQSMPDFTAMYKVSLNQLLPTGDTSIGSGAGDPNVSKTPAGQKNMAANLSIDDDDFKDNLYVTYEMKAKSMINTMFANMQGSDLLRLSDEQRDILIKAGMPWPKDEQGNASNELNVIWDETRATFDFEMEADQDKTADDQQRLTGMLTVAKFASSDPQFDAYLEQDGKRLNRGELYSDIISLTSDNKKIIEDISPDDKQKMEQEQAAAQDQGQEQELPASESMSFKDVAAIAPTAAAAMLERNGLPSDDLTGATAEQVQATQNPAQAGAAPGEEQAPPDQGQAGDAEQQEVQEIMQRYQVDQPTAQAMRQATLSGWGEKEILDAKNRSDQRLAQAQPQPAGAVA